MRSSNKDVGPGLVDVATGEATILVPDRTVDVWGPSFSADGSRVAVVLHDPFVSGDLAVWDAVTGRQVATRPAAGPMALSPDGRTVAVSAVDAVDVLDAETLDRRHTLEGLGTVTRFVFDPRGDQIATVSLDGTVRVWDARSGALRFVPPAEPGGVEVVAFNADGSRIVVVYASGRIIVHPIALSDAIEIARGRVTRSLTDDECRRYLHLEACAS